MKKVKMNRQKNVCFICCLEETNTKYNNIYKTYLKNSKHFAISDVEDSNTHFVDALRNFTNLPLIKTDTLNHYFCNKCEFRFIDAYLVRQEMIQCCKKNNVNLTDSINITNNSDISRLPKTKPTKTYFEDVTEPSQSSVRISKQEDPCMIIGDSDSDTDDSHNYEDLGLETLMNEINIPPQGIRIITLEMICADGKPGITETNYQKNKIQEDNVGFRMLKKIGWSGGSLGKNMTGIEEPIRVDVRTNRKGLGTETTTNNANKFHYQIVYNFLKKYSYSTEDRDFVFANDFTERHKNIVFGICKRVKLHTRRVGDKNNLSVLQISKSPLLDA